MIYIKPLKRHFLAAALVLLSGAALSQDGPQPRLPTIEITAGMHVIQAEVAQSPAQQMVGMMFRKEMGANEGMLFANPDSSQRCFWMRNTLIPLDIIFVGQDGRIINISANAEPETLTPRQSLGIASAVLELNGGRAQQLGIKPGALVKW